MTKEINELTGSQQPLGLALSFYKTEFRLALTLINLCLNSRLGLHWVFTRWSRWQEFFIRCERLNSRLGLHWVFTCRTIRKPLRQRSWRLNSRLGLHWVFTALEDEYYNEMSESQQPLGLALSFYLRRSMEQRTLNPHWSQQPLGLALSFYHGAADGGFLVGLERVSTAAWACIEFLQLSKFSKKN